MNNLSFTNFRRFEKFGPFQYSGITFLVGRNNAGKSTLVKALLLIDNYIKSESIETLSFENNILEDVNILTYGRAKNRNAKDNSISFSFEFDNYVVNLVVSGDDDQSYARVQKLIIADTVHGFGFMFFINSGIVRVVMDDSRRNDNIPEDGMMLLSKSLLEIQNDLEKTAFAKTSVEYIELISKREKLESRLKELEVSKKGSAQNSYQIEGFFELNESLATIAENVINGAENEYATAFKAIQNGEPTPKNFVDLKAFHDYGFVNIQYGIFEEFMQYIKSSSLNYIGGNVCKQSALFRIRDKHNPLSKAIHEFNQLEIIPGELEHRFVLEWMNKFDIGNDFKINMYAGEAYEMKILSAEGEIHLADKGMGSVQAMLLILRIACIIKKSNNFKKVWKDYGLKDYNTVIIEEPELNLHPALQSLLADLFLDVYEKYGVNFIIETHSEYILRRSQVLVAEKEFETAPNENPFCAHYFPKDADATPYELNYQQDGTFDKNFGTGFFDTASLDTLKLLRIKREKKA